MTRSRLTTATVAGVAATIVFLAGMAARAGLDASGSTAAPPDRTAPPAAAPPATPSDGGDGVEGAVAAALAWVLNGQQLLDSSTDDAEALIRNASAASTADANAAETRQRLEDLHQQLAAAENIRFDQAALAVRSERTGPGRATVAVWHVGVLSAPPIAPPQAGWSTTTLDLLFEGGRWRVVTADSVPGPAPILSGDAAPATSSDYQSRLAGFHPWRPS